MLLCCEKRVLLCLGEMFLFMHLTEGVLIVLILSTREQGQRSGNEGGEALLTV